MPVPATFQTAIPPARRRWTPLLLQRGHQRWRDLVNELFKTAALERQALRDAHDSKTPPPEHVDFLTTTGGTVLTGQAFLELRGAVSLGRPQFLGRLGAIRRAGEQAATAVEKVLLTT